MKLRIAKAWNALVRKLAQGHVDRSLRVLRQSGVIDAWSHSEISFMLTDHCTASHADNAAAQSALEERVASRR